MAGHASARSRLILLLILLAAFGLRLYQLGAQSLWYDETVSVHLAGKPVAALVAHTAGDIHPPGYYVLLRGWLLLFSYPTGHADPDGHGLEFSAALLSLAFGMALIPLIYVLGRSLYDEPTALLAAALTAVSPFHIWYSQEVRMYTLGAALGLICLRCAIQFVSRPAAGVRLVINHQAERAKPAKAGCSQADHRPLSDQGMLIVYVLAAAAGLYTLYYFAFLLVALNLWVIAVAGSRFRVPGSKLTQGSTSDSKPPTSIFHSPSSILCLWFLAQAAVVLL